jgi:hypothetical protein
MNASICVQGKTLENSLSFTSKDVMRTTLTPGLMSFTFLASCIQDSPGILMSDTIRKKSCALDLNLSSASSGLVNPSTDNPFFRRHFLRTWTISGSSSTTNVLDAILLPLPFVRTLLSLRS